MISPGMKSVKRMEYGVNVHHHHSFLTILQGSNRYKLISILKPIASAPASQPQSGRKPNKKSLPIALIPINLLDSKPDKQGTANNLQPTNLNRRPPHYQANPKEPIQYKRWSNFKNRTTHFNSSELASPDTSRFFIEKMNRYRIGTRRKLKLQSLNAIAMKRACSLQTQLVPIHRETRMNRRSALAKIHMRVPSDLKKQIIFGWKMI